MHLLVHIQNHSTKTIRIIINTSKTKVGNQNQLLSFAVPFPFLLNSISPINKQNNTDQNQNLNLSSSPPPNPKKPRKQEKHTQHTHKFNSLMIPFSLLLSLSFSLSFAQSEDQYSPTPGPTVYFRPSVAIVIGIFAMMFSLTFLLLMYAKYYHNNSPGLAANDADVFLSPDRAHSPLTGIAKSVIESLPFFRFSALRGSRSGMECAVCLSPYTDAELLRLLPACKHVFHMSCVDQWLECHSSCPLCRAPVLEYSADQAGDDIITPDMLSLFVEREPSSRFDEIKKEAVHEKKGAEKPATVAPVYDKFKHRIVISGVVLKSRWSDLNSADLMSLNCDMLRVDSSRRFSMPDLVSMPEKNIPVK